MPFDTFLMNTSRNTTTHLRDENVELTDFYPHWFTILLCIFLIISFAVGVILNLSVLIGGYSKHLKADSGNHFIRSVSIVDVLLCLTLMPMTLAIAVQYPKLNTITCYLHEGLVSFAVTASAVCIALVSVDRYGAIVTPTQRKIHANNVKVIKFAIILTSGIGFAIPFFSLPLSNSMNVLLHAIKPGKTCRNILLSISPTFFYETYYMTVFAFAVIAVSVSYTKIMKVARTRITTTPGVVRTNYKFSKQDIKIQERKVLRLTVAIVFSFVICWGSYVVASFLQLVLNVGLSFDMFRLCCLALAMTTTSIHPLVYTFIHSDLRQAYIKRIKMEPNNRSRTFPIHSSPTTLVPDVVLKSGSQGLSVGINADFEDFTTEQGSTNEEISLRGLEYQKQSHQDFPVKNSEGKIVTVASFDPMLSQDQPNTSRFHDLKRSTSLPRKQRFVSQSISSTDSDVNVQMNKLPEVVVSATKLRQDASFSQMHISMSNKSKDFQRKIQSDQHNSFDIPNQHTGIYYPEDSPST